MQPRVAQSNEPIVDELKSALEGSGLDSHVKKGCLNVFQDAANAIDFHGKNRGFAVLYLGSEYLSWTAVTISQGADETNVRVRQDSGEDFELGQALVSLKELHTMFDKDYEFNRTHDLQPVNEIDHDSCIIALDNSGDDVRYFVTSSSRFSAGSDGNKLLTFVEELLAQRQ
jgi:hypothetical protein